ncbi:hypothetical protein Pfo_003516 [Paulownia fortunei]|nr:hypothetical protein Pfo_003516 [Paulownia fortunei]
MLNLIKFEFITLDISENNYLTWTLDADIYFDAMNLGEIIKEGNEASLQDRTKAMIFIRHHFHDELKTEYLTIKNLYVLWKNLKERYNHEKTIILPKYNSTMFKITSQLKLCGESITDEDMLEKTFSIFYASNILLQQQYRERGFKKYSELISLNAAIVNNFGSSRYRGSGQGRGHSRGRSCGRGQEENGLQNKTLKTNENNYHRCGMKGHWRHTCRTSKHLIDLY